MAVEEDALVAEQVAGTLPALFWRWVDPAVRHAEAARLEALLLERVEAVDGASRKAVYFNAWRDIATTGAALERMERIWRGDEPVPGLPLAEQDLSTLALHLAVRDVPGATSILDEQAARIDNPDRGARFEFIRNAVDPDPAVRDAFFESLTRPERRAREEWVVTAVRYLNHPLRVESSIPYLRPSLELLREIRDTGDIFFPTRWLDAALAGHSSPAAAAIVEDFIGRQENYPPRLMGKLLQSADPLFRVASMREADTAD